LFFDFFIWKNNFCELRYGIEIPTEINLQ